MFPGGSEDKASAFHVGDPGSIPGLGRSPGERNGNPLQYSCLENFMDRGAWQATVHGVAKVRHDWESSLWLNIDFDEFFFFSLCSLPNLQYKGSYFLHIWSPYIGKILFIDRITFYGYVDFIMFLIIEKIPHLENS